MYTCEPSQATSGVVHIQADFGALAWCLPASGFARKPYACRTGADGGRPCVRVNIRASNELEFLFWALGACGRVCVPVGEEVYSILVRRPE